MHCVDKGLRRFLHYLSAGQSRSRVCTLLFVQNSNLLQKLIACLKLLLPQPELLELLCGLSKLCLDDIRPFLQIYLLLNLCQTQDCHRRGCGESADLLLLSGTFLGLPVLFPLPVFAACLRCLCRQALLQEITSKVQILQCVPA